MMAVSGGSGLGIGVGNMGMGGGGNVGHHQTMFFGPAHGLSQYSSLPRRSTAGGSAFQRNTPIRRSTGIPEHHMDYFVPRSISEFNLSGVGDLALPPPRRYSPTIIQNIGGGGLGLPHGLQLGPPQTLLCSAPQQQPPPPAQLQIVMKPRGEKMVTFEDESKAMAAAAAAAAATHCPHGVPTTPRKLTGSGATSSGGVLGGVGADIFM